MKTSEKREEIAILHYQVNQNLARIKVLESSIGEETRSFIKYIADEICIRLNKYKPGFLIS
jgi:hypothetical protein